MLKLNCTVVGIRLLEGIVEITLEQKDFPPDPSENLDVNMFDVQGMMKAQVQMMQKAQKIMLPFKDNQIRICIPKDCFDEQSGFGFGTDVVLTLEIDKRKGKDYL